MADDRNHYEVIGVEPDADKDEIRDAYRSRLDELQAEADRRGAEKTADARRAETAALNAAWQVLSDPYQRGRYDAQAGIDTGAEEPTGDDGVPTDDEADDEGDGGDDGGGKSAIEKRMTRPRQDPAETPASYPPGLQVPPPRARLIAMAIDIAVLGVLTVSLQFGANQVARSIYSEQYDEIDDLNDQIDEAEDDLDEAEDALEDIEDEPAPETTGEATGTTVSTIAPTETSAPDETTTTAETAEDAARDEVRTAENRLDDLEERRDELESETAPATIGGLAFTLLVCLAYLVPSSALSGRTLGKRLMVIRAVRVDGSPLGWSGSIRRYGPPVLLGFALLPVLGPLSFFLVLIGVLTWPRNATRQGIHDRLAGTIVVDG